MKSKNLTMKKHSTSVDRDSTLSDISASQADLWIRCNLNQNPSKIFMNVKKKDSKVYMEWKIIWFGQHNIEEQFCRAKAV